MKKILFAILITVVGLAGALLVFTRGGGGGIDPNDSSNGQIHSSIPKPAALPQICTAYQKVDPLQKPSQVIRQQTSTCTAEFPVNLQVNSYCLNKPNKLGGATVVLPQGSSEFINLPKNCTAVFEEDKLYAKKVACSGPAGSKVNLPVQNSCTPPDANLPEKIEGSCPPDFTINPYGYGGCEYRPPPNSPPCPGGYHFESSSNCCKENSKGFGSMSACPNGYLTFMDWRPAAEELKYEKITMCVRKSSLDNTTNTRSYTITLGYCNEKKPIESDKPQSCIIDPVTGVCK